jgi:hypothetical protein
VGRIEGYQDGGYEPGDDDNEPWDTVGDNPTGRPRKSSARQRRKKDRKLFKGTRWGRKGDDK